WLPSDFFVDATNGSVKIVSPGINNVHPTKHKALYSVIESVLSSFVLLFEHITRLRSLGRVPNGFTGVTVPYIWDKRKVEAKGMTEGEDQKLQHESSIVLPEAFEEYTGELKESIAPYSLHGKTIHGIIKLANIHLTAENPEYVGGSWHVEGA
ncbi:hypothetical protein FB451DRAFT_1007083, partial [Mycena latifolia]